MVKHCPEFLRILARGVSIGVTDSFFRRSESDRKKIFLTCSTEVDEKINGKQKKW